MRVAMKNIFLIFFLFNIINSINLPWLVHNLSTQGKDNFLFYCYPENSYSHCDFRVNKTKTEVDLSYVFNQSDYGESYYGESDYGGSHYGQRFTIKKINDHLYFLDGKQFFSYGKFHHGFLRSVSKDQAVVFFQQPGRNSKGLYIIIKPKFETYSKSTDIDTNKLTVNCEEKGVSVQESLDNNRVEISGESINITNNDDLTTLFKSLKSSPKLVSTCTPSLNGCYENSLFLLIEILKKSQVKPSIIRIYCPTNDKYCLHGRYDHHHALIIRNKKDGEDYIIDPIFGLESISLKNWINNLNSKHNAKLCLFSLLPNIEHTKLGDLKDQHYIEFRAKVQSVDSHRFDS